MSVNSRMRHLIPQMTVNYQIFVQILGCLYLFDHTVRLTSIWEKPDCAIQEKPLMIYQSQILVVSCLFGICRLHSNGTAVFTESIKGAGTQTT